MIEFLLTGVQIPLWFVAITALYISFQIWLSNILKKGYLNDD